MSDDIKRYDKKAEPDGTSWHTDEENRRGATSGEGEFYNPEGLTSDRGLLAPVKAGPLAGIDLLHYCRTGHVRRKDGRPLTEEQARLV